MKGCGRPNCSISTGICGSLTFGCGELDKNGYWEEPCELCARVFEQAYPEHGSCWPYFESEIVSSAEVYDYITLIKYINNHSYKNFCEDIFEDDSIRDMIAELNRNIGYRYKLKSTSNQIFGSAYVET